MREWVAEYISKYSFIKSYKLIGTYWYFYLQDTCPIKSFRINKYRTTRGLLTKKINNIKKKIGYNDETGDWKKQIENKE